MDGPFPSAAGSGRARAGGRNTSHHPPKANGAIRKARLDVPDRIGKSTLARIGIAVVRNGQS